MERPGGVGVREHLVASLGGRNFPSWALTVMGDQGTQWVGQTMTLTHYPGWRAGCSTGWQEPESGIGGQEWQLFGPRSTGEHPPFKCREQLVRAWPGWPQ